MHESSEFGSWVLESWRRNLTRPANNAPPEKTKPADDKASDQPRHWAICPCTGEVLSETPQVPSLAPVE